MEKQDMVSIIMPTYNCADYIIEAINSVKGQTYKNWELLIVDDCSADNTKDIVSKMQADDERIHYFRNDGRRGAAESRNKALREAKGHWIAFLDSDDLWLPEKLERQIRFMTDNNYHFSYHKYSCINEKSEPLGMTVGGISKVGKMAMYCCCWQGCLTVMYDRDYIGLIQVASIKRNNDSAIWLKAVDKAPCYYLDENLANYRNRKGSLTPPSIWKKISAHYPLFRNGAGMNPLLAWMMVFINVPVSAYKKMCYIKTEEK